MPLFCRIDVIAWGICTPFHSITAYGLDIPPTLKILLNSKRYKRFVDVGVTSPALIDSVASIVVMNVLVDEVGWWDLFVLVVEQNVFIDIFEVVSEDRGKLSVVLAP